MSSPPSSHPQPQPQPQSLNIIALISGGKDSLYSLLHCLRNGHRIVALANLYPPGQSTQQGNDYLKDEKGEKENENEADEEDIDSFMYQTIGHSVVPLYEQALGIPLYRGEILGGARDEGRVYGENLHLHSHSSFPNPDSASDSEGESKDETESLVPLLKRIKRAHPDANAVSAGAILSTYQRTRIEHVAARLGLIPLAWLWMYPFLPDPVERKGVGSDAGLLEDMAAAGCEARIIKVASGGLDEGFLWGDVSEAGTRLRGRIVKGMRRFAGGQDVRGAVLGEGGEYETLALDGPGFLWKARIEMLEVVETKGDGGVRFLRLKGARCVSKEDSGSGMGVRPEDVRRPELLDGVFEGTLEEVLASPPGGEDIAASTESLNLVDSFSAGYQVAQTKNGGLWTVSNITALEAGPGAGEQMNGIARKMIAMLDGVRSTDDIVFATVLLHSMADFATVNGVYASLFKRPNPPARATVACGNSLCKGVKVMASFVVDLGPRDLRQGLHVQSRSYWAPANIGPYSQAMSIAHGAGRLVYIAGQIPLEPASMELVSRSSEDGRSWFDNYSLRVVLSLQHLWRIGTAMEVDWWLGAIAFLVGESCMEIKAHIAWQIWKKMHTRKNEEEEEDDEPVLDAWDIKYGRRGDEQALKPALPDLPYFAVVQSTASIPPFFAVQVEELPRGSDIEWQGLGCRCDRVAVAPMEIQHGYQIDTVVDDDFTYTCIEIGIEHSDMVPQGLQRIIDTHCQHTQAHAVAYTRYPLSGSSTHGQIVPCKAIWGQEGRRLAAGIVLQREKSR